MSTAESSDPKSSNQPSNASGSTLNSTMTETESSTLSLLISGTNSSISSLYKYSERLEKVLKDHKLKASSPESGTFSLGIPVNSGLSAKKNFETFLKNQRCLGAQEQDMMWHLNSYLNQFKERAKKNGSVELTQAVETFNSHLSKLKKLTAITSALDLVTQILDVGFDDEGTDSHDKMSCSIGGSELYFARLQVVINAQVSRIKYTNEQISKMVEECFKSTHSKSDDEVNAEENDVPESSLYTNASKSSLFSSPPKTSTYTSPFNSNLSTDAPKPSIFSFTSAPKSSTDAPKPSIFPSTSAPKSSAYSFTPKPKKFTTAPEPSPDSASDTNDASSDPTNTSLRSKQLILGIENGINALSQQVASPAIRTEQTVYTGCGNTGLWPVMEDVNAQMKFYKIDKFVDMKEGTYKNRIPSAVRNQFYLAARALETKLSQSTRQKLFKMNKTHELRGELLPSVVHILNEIAEQIDPQLKSQITTRSFVRGTNETFDEFVDRLEDTFLRVIPEHNWKYGNLFDFRACISYGHRKHYPVSYKQFSDAIIGSQALHYSNAHDVIQWCVDNSGVRFEAPTEKA